jgi:hypothetical protein
MKKARVVALEDGTVEIFVDEGSFAEAREATERLLALFAAQGVPVKLVGEIEQHRADVQHVHIQEEVRREQ